MQSAERKSALLGVSDSTSYRTGTPGQRQVPFPSRGVRAVGGQVVCRTSASRWAWKGRADRSTTPVYAYLFGLLSPDWRARRLFPRGRCALARGSSLFPGPCVVTSPVFLALVGGLDPGAARSERTATLNAAHQLT